MKRRMQCLRRLGRGLSKLMPDLLAVAGASLLVRGAWMIRSPAGWLTAGALLIAAAVIVSRAGGEQK